MPWHRSPLTRANLTRLAHAPWTPRPLWLNWEQRSASMRSKSPSTLSLSTATRPLLINNWPRSTHTSSRLINTLSRSSNGKLSIHQCTPSWPHLSQPKLLPPLHPPRTAPLTAVPHLPHTAPPTVALFPPCTLRNLGARASMTSGTNSQFSTVEIQSTVRSCRTGSHLEVSRTICSQQASWGSRWQINSRKQSLKIRLRSTFAW